MRLVSWIENWSLHGGKNFVDVFRVGFYFIYTMPQTLTSNLLDALLLFKHH
jgi:hypothetical protein